MKFHLLMHSPLIFSTFYHKVSNILNSQKKKFKSFMHRHSKQPKIYIASFGKKIAELM